MPQAEATECVCRELVARPCPAPETHTATDPKWDARVQSGHLGEEGSAGPRGCCRRSRGISGTLGR